MSEVVEVTGASVGVDVASTKLETSLNDTFYNQIPTQRNVTGLFYAAAGVNDGGGTRRANPSVAGGSGLENQYVADGANITDGSLGGIGVFSRNYGPLSTGINLSFVKEVDVKTGGFEPQYGKSTGGSIWSLAAINTTGYSKLSNGSRNWVVRYNANLSQTWLFNEDLPQWPTSLLNRPASKPPVTGQGAAHNLKPPALPR